MNEQPKTMALEDWLRAYEGKLDGPLRSEKISKMVWGDLEQAISYIPWPTIVEALNEIFGALGWTDSIENLGQPDSEELEKGWRASAWAHARISLHPCNVPICQMDDVGWREAVAPSRVLAEAKASRGAVRMAKAMACARLGPKLGLALFVGQAEAYRRGWIEGKPPAWWPPNSLQAIEAQFGGGESVESTPPDPKPEPHSGPKCRSCSAPITWGKTAKGRPVPLDLDGESHFTTCPDAPEWSKKGTRKRPKPTPHNGSPRKPQRPPRCPNCNNDLDAEGYGTAGGCPKCWREEPEDHPNLTLRVCRQDECGEEAPEGEDFCEHHRDYHQEPYRPPEEKTVVTASDGDLFSYPDGGFRDWLPETLLLDLDRAHLHSADDELDKELRRRLYRATAWAFAEPGVIPGKALVDSVVELVAKWIDGLEAPFKPITLRQAGAFVTEASNQLRVEKDVQRRKREQGEYEGRSRFPDADLMASLSPELVNYKPMQVEGEYDFVITGANQTLTGSAARKTVLMLSITKAGAKVPFALRFDGEKQRRRNWAFLGCLELEGFRVHDLLDSPIFLVGQGGRAIFGEAAGGKGRVNFVTRKRKTEDLFEHEAIPEQEVGDIA